MIKKAHKRSVERVMLRVGKGVLIPDNQFTIDSLRARGFKLGDVLSAELRKPRDGLAHRRAHALGKLCAENLDAFTGLSAHKVLKRIQLEANIGCEEIAYQVQGHGTVVQRIPMSLAFESMDDGEFNEVYCGFCQHVIDRYWPELDLDQIEEMSKLVGLAA